MRILGLMMIALLASCNQDDHFAAGKWETKAWMESSAQPGQTPAQTDTVQLSESDAAQSPKSILFGRFYRGMNNADVTLANGKINGSYEQRRVDDFAGHTVPISGTYSTDKFRVVLTFKALGMDVDQIVEGKLVEPKI